MLEVVSSERAKEIIMECTPPCSVSETVPLSDALQRVSTADVFSPEDLPAFSRSTVDGFAVRASDTYGCSESIPAMLNYEGEILMGEAPPHPLQNGGCFKIPTGGQLPEGADAVCMVEYSDDIGDEFRYIYRPVAVHENVVRKGEDCEKGSLVLKKGERIGAKNIAILAALGIADVEVAAKIKVGVISTGDELIPFDKKPEKAQIRDINSILLASEIRETGAEAVIYPSVRDNVEDLYACAKQAIAECDMICISGGSSAGEKDSTMQVLDRLGDVKFHGISIKPGKPTIFADICGKPAFGLPGHPQAAFFIFRLFAVPAILKRMALSEPVRSRKCILDQNIPSNHGREEIVPVMIRGESAEPVRSKSGVVSVLSDADGYLLIDRNTEGLAKGSAVDIYLF